MCRLPWKLPSSLEQPTIESASAGVTIRPCPSTTTRLVSCSTRGIGLDLNGVAPEIEPLLDALSRQAPKTALEQAAADATEALWSDELETELVQELQEFRE